MTFRDFLSTQRAKFDPEGDFIRLALRDPDLPAFTSFEELRKYVAGNPALAGFDEPCRALSVTYVRAKRQGAA